MILALINFGGRSMGPFLTSSAYSILQGAVLIVIFGPLHFTLEEKLVEF